MLNLSIDMKNQIRFLSLLTKLPLDIKFHIIRIKGLLFLNVFISNLQ